MSTLRTTVCLSASFLVGLACAISLGDLSNSADGAAVRSSDEQPRGRVVDQNLETPRRADDLT